MSCPTFNVNRLHNATRNVRDKNNNSYFNLKGTSGSATSCSAGLLLEQRWMEAKQVGGVC